MFGNTLNRTVLKLWSGLGIANFLGSRREDSYILPLVEKTRHVGIGYRSLTLAAGGTKLEVFHQHWYVVEYSLSEAVSTNPPVSGESVGPPQFGSVLP
jgi:hypothetical protein